LLDPARRAIFLTAEANRISNGKTTGLYHVEVKNGDKLVAFFSGVAYRKLNHAMDCSAKRMLI
jgi:hypothetical protein